MAASWITLYPEYYVRERALIQRHYPGLRVDEPQLAMGRLILAGELTVRVPGGSRRHPVHIQYPEDTPFNFPIVTPLIAVPAWTEDGGISGSLEAQRFDHRHQMPDGNLCLFQIEPRLHAGGDVLSIVHILRRAEQWFVGHHTGRWPPDTIDSELESHFKYASDLLIDDAFYRPELEGHGRMFLVVDLQRLHENQGTDACPMIVTALTEESDVVQITDARANLSKVYPWIGDAVWNADRLAAEMDLGDQEKAYLAHGYWWSLPAEPAPFHDGAGLLHTLSAISPEGDGLLFLCQALGPGEVLGADTVTIGFKYPGRDGEPEWLILYVCLGPKGPQGVPILGADAERERILKARIATFHTHRLSPHKLQLRNHGVVSADIGAKLVAFVGVGALGSKVAELLGQAGLGAFRLCDHDRLVPGNIARHIGSVRDFGAKKVEVVAQRLLHINPYLTFAAGDIRFGPATANLSELTSFLGGVDLVICTTADESVEAVVNQAAVMMNIPALYARSIRRGSMGRVFLVRPRVDPCKACLAGYLQVGRDGGEPPEGWVDIPEGDEDVLYHECGRPVLAASAVDMSFTATLTASIALDYLGDPNIERNHWVWTRTPAGELHDDLAKPMSTLVCSLPPRDGCPACSEPDVAAVRMDTEHQATLTGIVEEAPTTETGGLLIGYVEDRTAIITRITGPGPNAVKTATLFRRDVDFVQAELDKAIEDLGEHGQYLGEWHSHLVPDPYPSALDVESLFGVSQAPNYLTRCPISVIAGLDTATGQVANVRAWSFPVQGRMYSIDIDEV